VKRAILLSPYFAPSNLAGAQRTRLMASHLPEFGWEPIVVSVDPSCYEEPNDPPSLALLPEWLRVERVGAWPARICRPLGFGDVSLRAQWTLRRKVAELIRREKIDLIFATVLPGYTSLIGAWAKRKFGLPFVLDYQDPWVSDWGAKPRLSKAGIAHWLAVKLELKVVPLADALTAVSSETLASLRARDLLGRQTPVEIIPIGAEYRDQEVARDLGHSFVEGDDAFQITYLGTITHRMMPALKAFFAALATTRERVSRPIRFNLIGTFEPDIAKIVRELGAQEVTRFHTHRIGYLDALRTMQDSDLLVLLGSTDPHYTASKIFPYWLSEKSLVGIFHERSEAVQLCQELGGIELVLFNEQRAPDQRVEALTKILSRFLNGEQATSPRNEQAFARYSSKGIAERFTGLFDRVIADAPLS
jgi:glycosyltransferase involved in cell wall biosynthesis